MSPPPSAAAEPTPAVFANPLAKYLAATRPAFLSVTLVAGLLGLASAHFGGVAVDALRAAVTIAFALLAHAGVNVINDYYDALNGSDAANSERLFPFTGGSRFIQNGVLSPRQTAVFGYALLLAVIPAGLWLTLHSAPGLIAIGMAGLFVGWAYSAPPFKLMCRGLGELAIVAGWLLVVLGSDFVQRGAFALPPLLVGLPYALLVAAILYINQFPDRRADASVGKRTLVVRLASRQARLGYLLLVGAAYCGLLLAILAGALPWFAAAGLLPLPLSLQAARVLLRHAEQPAALAPAIKLTIAAANLHGLLLAVGLWCAAR
jgi:1,4-dihydroxy-2-naphthoate octaprenyltransferase